jgi:hypothetical protein
MFKCKIQNKELLYEIYVNKKMSTTEISKNSQEIFGFNVSVSSVYNTIVLYKIPLRNKSESVSRSKSTLDIDSSFLNEKLIEWVDGFLLGDGSIGFRKRDYMGSRFSFGSSEKQWTELAMSGLNDYNFTAPKHSEHTKNGKKTYTWNSQTKSHPDIVSQAKRWYPNGIKKVPEDVRITPTSILLWYLGDGSFTAFGGNSSHLLLATCAFDPSDIENILMPKLKALGIESIRTQQKNDISICSTSIKVFFDIIGHKSPISCYNRKFDVPEWLFLKNLKSIIPDRRERWQAIYYIRKGEIGCQKSPGGHYFLFNEDQEKELLNKMKSLVK